MTVLSRERSRKMNVMFRFAVSSPRDAVPLFVTHPPRDYVRMHPTVRDTPIPTNRLNIGASCHEVQSILHAKTPPIAICG